MSKARNIVFVTLVLACLLSVVGCRVVVKAASIEVDNRSVLEGRTYQTFPEISVASLTDGSFQDDFEQYVADIVPGRDSVLLANAAVQRALIQLANVPFGFEAYPTYYGSDYVYVPSVGAVLQDALTIDEKPLSSLAAWAEEYIELFEEYPDVDWVFYLADRGSTSAANPAVNLINDAADYDYLRTGFLELIATSCTVVDGAYYDLEEFAENYFLTDHHWNIRGAIAAYEGIIEALGKDAIEFGDVFEGFSGVFWGSGTRNGLAACGTGDVVYDVEYSRSSLSVVAGGTARDLSFLDESYVSDFSGYTKTTLFENVYASYYHGDYALIEIENLDIQNGEVLLIVGDSFTNCMERFFAESYQYVYVIDPRYYTTMTIGEFISSHGVDDVVFILTVDNIDDAAAIL